MENLKDLLTNDEIQELKSVEIPASSGGFGQGSPVKVRIYKIANDEEILDGSFESQNETARYLEMQLKDIGVEMPIPERFSSRDYIQRAIKKFMLKGLGVEIVFSPIRKKVALASRT